MVLGSSIDSSLKPAIANKNSLLFHLLTITIGTVFCTGLSVALFSIFIDVNLTNGNIINTLSGCVFVYIASSISLHQLGKYPGNRPLSYLLPISLIYLLIFIAVINIFRLEYSRSALIIGSVVTIFTTFLEFKLRQLSQKATYTVIPMGFYEQLTACNPDKFIPLSSPDEADRKQVRSIIVDSNEQLTPQWQKFVAQQMSKGIPIIDTVSAYECITGKSPLDHYGELASHDIAPSQVFMTLKRILETLLILASLPLSLPLILLVALAVKIESPGPAFFIQRRVGRGGKEFSMYKIRSMCLDSEKHGSQFAGEDDPRITRIGKFIRKMRIDELPQFLNILKGDMALIGPRPEQASFVKEFEEKIPLYSYRHVVRPGITGWAQVTHGYAANEDETREKLAHDFYYVKNLSLWLDLDIVFKTIKTMLTGFGAR